MMIFSNNERGWCSQLCAEIVLFEHTEYDPDSALPPSHEKEWHRPQWGSPEVHLRGKEGKHTDKANTT